MPQCFDRFAWFLPAVAAVACAGAVALQARAQSPAISGNAVGVGNPENGKAVFEKCAACHALDDSGTDGPSLKGVFGRKAGTRDDYRYSAAMVRSGIVWTADTIDAYVADPQGYIRGNRMSFAGITDKSERQDLIAYLVQATKPQE
jgi:cytochrome c